MKKTISVLIGNSDNRLTQGDWATMLAQLETIVNSTCTAVHFSGTSDPYAVWQNACAVGEIEIEKLPELRAKLGKVCDMFNQESIALVVGEVELVKGAAE